MNRCQGSHDRYRLGAVVSARIVRRPFLTEADIQPHARSSMPPMQRGGPDPTFTPL